MNVWSMSVYGSPPAVTIWSGKEGLPDSRKEIALFSFDSRTLRDSYLPGLRAMIAAHNDVEQLADVWVRRFIGKTAFIFGLALGVVVGVILARAFIYA